MSNRNVIKISDNEFSIKRAKKVGKELGRKGIKVAYDLRGIKNRELLRDIIMDISNINKEN